MPRRYKAPDNIQCVSLHSAAVSEGVTDNPYFHISVLVC